MPTSRRAFLACAGAGLGSTGLTAGLAMAADRPTVERSAQGLHILSSYVSGSDRFDGPACAGDMFKGQGVRLEREPRNRYDALAVSVWTHDGLNKLGYIPRIHNQALAHLMDAGFAVRATISGLGGTGSNPDIAVNVTADVVPFASQHSA
jgi:hypothetical protein